MADLVDLSLFAVSPTNDSHFALNDESIESPSASLPHPTMKALPQIPNRRYNAIALDSRSPASSPTRGLLNRMKRLRLDTTLPAPSKLVERNRPGRSLQQRRHHESLTHTLIIPTMPSSGSNAGVQHAAASATVSNGCSAVPMIWLPDEEIWLVADPTPSEYVDTYGYYAPAPHSDPGPWEYATESADYGDSPPSYASTMLNDINASPAEVSPIRSQFLSLMDPRRGQQTWPRQRRAQSVPKREEANVDMSPLFQEAISGVGFGVSHEGSGDDWSRSSGRRDSWDYNLFSGISPEAVESRWRLRRSTSSRV